MIIINIINNNDNKSQLKFYYIKTNNDENKSNEF